MAKIKKRKIQRLWVLVSIVIVVLFFLYNSPKNNPFQSQQSSVKYITYEDFTYSFSIKYPQSWKIQKTTQVFENGDVIAFRKLGNSQKTQTELYDGVQLTISKPFEINTDIKTWVKSYFSSKAEFSQNTINGHTYQKVYTCGLGCMTFYYTSINGRVYGVAAFAEGADKMVYENAVVYMLKSLQFTNANNRNLSKEDAVAKVKALPQVIDYLKRVPNGLIAVNGDEDNSYLIQVYELKNGHTATFNWYKVGKTTGEITAAVLN